MASKTKDLRAATEDIGRVKKLAYKQFGFREYLVNPIEMDATDPSHHCLFEVMRVTYKVADGAISVVPAED